MSTELFRKEVLERKGDEWLDSILLRAPNIGWTFFAISLFAISAVAGLIFLGKVTSYERAQGALVPTDGLLSILQSESGRIVHVLIEEGSFVKAGQPMIEISNETSSPSTGEMHAVIGAQISLKRKHLLEEIDELSAMAKAKRRELESSDGLFQAQVEQAKEKLALVSERANNATQLYEHWSKAVSRGVVSKVQLLQQHNTALEYQSQVKDLRAQIIQIEQQREASRGELTQLPLDTERKQSELRRQLADLSEDQAQNEAKRLTVLKAPADGMVTSVFVHPGDAVVPQETLANLLPASSTLVAELWLPPSSIGRIHPGQRVVIRYKAFPYQRFGKYRGEVLSVSGSAVAANDITRILGEPLPEGGPRYRVRVALEQQFVSLGKHDEPLIPGLTFDADIVLERRRISSWFFSPPAKDGAEAGSSNVGSNHG